MSRFFVDPNVVYFFGIYQSPSKEQYIVTELLPLGNLRDLLQKNQSNFTQQQLLSVAQQTCAGMTYLASHKIVHCDLAARNLLVKYGEAGDYIIKVADFGLSKVATKKKSEDQFLTRYPIKWSAVEILEHASFSSKSDVWSFGVTLFEIYSFGSEPYSGMKIEEVIQKVKSGYRLPQPSQCPDSIFHIMQMCFKTKPEDRPDFGTIFENL